MVLGLMECGADVEPEVVRCLIDRSTANQKPLQLPATARRGRGRPKDTEFDEWASGRFGLVRNAARVAQEAAKHFEIGTEAVLKRIIRADWYRGSPSPVALAKPTPPSRPAASCQRRPSLADKIEGYLQVQEPAKSEDIAAALGIGVRKVERALQEEMGIRFRYLLGELWERM